MQRYLNLLETSYQLVRLESYAVNRTNRLIKTPRLFWSDPGLALHLSGNAEPTGFHLENLVLTDLLACATPRCRGRRFSTGAPRPISKWTSSLSTRAGCSLWRSKARRGRDFSDTRGLRAFRDEYGEQFLGGLLLHAGEETQWLGQGILAAPWHRVI